MDKNFITIKELAVKVGVSEKTIYRMLNDNQIPFALKIGGQWRFRISAVETWLTAQTGSGTDTAAVNYNINVWAALNNGAVLYRIHGSNRDEALEELLTTLPRTGGLDAQAIKLAILAQESLVSSSLQGIAFMRPGRDCPFFVDRSIMIMGYLERPTDFKALDGRKAEIIFLMLPANMTEEAILDVRLRRLLMEPDFVSKIKGDMVRKDLLLLVRETEEKLLGLPGSTILHPQS